MEETTKTTIDLKEISVKDLNETVIPLNDLPKDVANAIFTNSNTIEVSDIARQLHKGESVEIEERELAEITHIILTMAALYKPWAWFQVTQYFTQKLDSLTNKT